MICATLDVIVLITDIVCILASYVNTDRLPEKTLIAG